MDRERLGRVLVLVYLLAVSSFLLENYESWQSQYIKLIQTIQPISESLYNNLSNYPRFFIQATGTIGILLSFAGMLGSKSSIRLLTFFVLLLILILNHTTHEINIADFEKSFIHIVKLISICGGLMQAW